MKKKVAIASDHAGYNLKVELIEHFKKKGLTFRDFGTFSDESTDYPDYGHLLADAVSGNEYPVGISLCGSGNGINMTANKHEKIRSALCWNTEIAKLARRHNNANICALPARFISAELAKEIVDIFLNTPFDGGRHKTRIDKIPIRK
jgi:ribose 5-phosphate isomerase B